MPYAKLPIVGPAGVILLLSAAGCTPEGPLSLAKLPGHKLDLSVKPRWTVASAEPAAKPKPKTKRPAPRKPALTAEQKRWFVPAGTKWRHIVIHHSATDAGSAEVFDAVHRARGWDELGYHFLINNGNGGPDGHVEVGARWTKQKWGAHCGGTPDNEYNNHGIGLCVVGDFSHCLPSKAQLAALERLVTFLTQAYEIPPENIVGHCNCPNAATECPGQRFLQHLHASLRPKITRKLAMGK